MICHFFSFDDAFHTFCNDRKYFYLFGECYGEKVRKNFHIQIKIEKWRRLLDEFINSIPFHTHMHLHFLITSVKEMTS